MKTEDIVVVIFVLLIVAAIAFIFLLPSGAVPVANNVQNSKGNAPELLGIKGYINTNSNISISKLVGKKVILIDFWTYTCINCIRTLPYMKQWDEKYRDDGLEIIGVHTPEFDFEKNYDNVKDAVEQYGLKYAVVQDNDYLTWRAYDNHYWPAKYLIDKNGNIVYTHFGEGNYEETEKKIQELLADLKNSSVDETISKPTDVQDVNFYGIGTPEIYFGYQFRRTSIANQPAYMPNEGIYDFTYDEAIQPNQPYLKGSWRNNMDNVELMNDSGVVSLLYTAKNANIVAGSDAGSEVTVIVDGKVHKTLVVNDQKLYEIVSGSDYSLHTVEIQVSGKGFKIYTFTFG